MRIVAGKWRSRLLPIADVAGLRPTAERIRETVFNWLAPIISGARCLDLFAGTGALGFEALSRDAAAVTFVERSGRAVTLLRRACRTLETDAAEVLQADGYELIRASADRPYDIVFLDPPFAHDSMEELCRLLDAGGWVAPGGRVYLEQDRGRRPPKLPDGWVLTHEKTAGNVRYMLARPGRASSGDRRG